MYFEVFDYVVAATLIVISLAGLIILISHSNTKMTHYIRFDEENHFYDFSCDPPKKILFPNISENASLSLSVVVPAYNEEKRLPLMLDECLSYLEERAKKQKDFSYEVIVVDDGSTDDTTKIGHNYSKKFGSDKIKVLTLVKNRGKGGAVRLGMLSSRGNYLLFADADGATKFRDIEKLEEEIRKLHEKDDNVVVVGSRAHLEEEAIASRSFFRTFLMYGFHMLVWLFGVRTVRDTQCGFKLFTRDAAEFLFPNLHVERWAFDVELLYLASYASMSVQEIAVNWTEIEGSKLVPVWSWLQMGKDLVLIWLKYQAGIWKIPDVKKKS